MSRYKVLCRDREWPQQGLYCCDKVRLGQGFCVATELALGKVFVLRQNILFRDRVWPNERFCVVTGKFRLRHSWLGWKILCRDRAFFGRDRVG